MNDSSVMKYFREISLIPRASFNEKAVSDYVKEWAEGLGLQTIQDDLWNLIVFKEATPGYEDAPVVMLQSHFDMVAEKNKDSNHDFDRDPIELIVGEDGYLRANNTTLGADDGAGVAYMMAVLGDSSLKHPKLECVFTVQEETGLTGAEMLDTSMLEATLCVGLDGSGETETYVSSSGGVRGSLTKAISWEKTDRNAVSIEIRGLLGGHSGESIDAERASATKLAGIILRRGLDKFPDLRLVAFDGGTKMNAITRESDFTVAVDDLAAFTTWFEVIVSEFALQYEFSDAGLNFNLLNSKTERQLNLQDTESIVNLVFMLPYGVEHKSMIIEGLTIASANIGTVDLREESFDVTISIRGTQEFVKENIMRHVSFIASTLGFELTYASSYPGWNFDSKSPFRQRLFDVYEDLRGEKMTTVATHGGMELGIWKDRLPKLDIVSFGPIMHDIHTPQERLHIESFDRTYEFLVAVLESLNTLS